MLDIEYYVKAVNESSSRCRGTVYAMLVASIILIIPFWNARPGNWNRERARYCQQKCAEAWSKAQTASTEDLKETYRRELTRLEGVCKALDQAHIAPITIAPFGIAVDTNDLSVLGGTGLVVMLIALRASLGRELANLRCAFKQAADDGQKLMQVYDLLSMGQILTVPRQREARHERPWNLFNKALFLGPLVSQAFGVLVNWRTLNLGTETNRFSAYFQVGGGAVLLLLIGWLTIVCYLTSRDYDREWSAKADELNIP